MALSRAPAKVLDHQLLETVLGALVGPGPTLRGISVTLALSSGVRTVAGTGGFGPLSVLVNGLSAVLTNALQERVLRIHLERLQ